MKLYHLAIIFIIIALPLFVIANIKTKQMAVISEDIEQLDEAFQKAIDDGVTELVEVEGMEHLSINKDKAVKDFFLSMYASLNISDNPDRQELLKNYIPIIAITCEDGYYLYYSDEYVDKDGFTYISKRWTEKQPYYFEDEDFIYRFNLNDIITLFDKNGLLDSTKEQQIFTLNYKELSSSSAYGDFRIRRPKSFLLQEESFYLLQREHIVDSIEQSLDYYMNEYNQLAKQMGINYGFRLPILDDSEWMRSITHPSMIVIFQGFPLRDGIEVYNRMVIAGAKISKEQVYYLEQKNWYYLYHENDCEELEEAGIFLMEEPQYTIYDCVKQGAYGCEICSRGRGVLAPQ